MAQLKSGSTVGGNTILTTASSVGANDINDLSDGYYAGYSLGLGLNALANDDGTSNYNTASGYESLRYNTSGYNNTASGYQSLFSNITGYSNTASGYQSLRSNTTGEKNTASGYRSLYTNTNSYNNARGRENTASGYESLYSNTTGYKNTAFGVNSLYSNISGNYNTASGHESSYSNTYGQYNTASGRYSLYTNASGSYNTAIGVWSLFDVEDGANNIGLGNHAGRSSSPSGSISGSSSNIMCLGNNSIQALYCADTSISSSDGRDKTDVEDFTAGLDFITQMRPVTYRWDKRTDYLDDDNTDPLSITPDGTHKKPKQHIGFISQEVQVLEQALGFATDKDNELICNTNEDATAMGLKYERLVPLLVNAIKELSAKVEALENA